MRHLWRRPTQLLLFLILTALLSTAVPAGTRRAPRKVRLAIVDIGTKEPEKIRRAILASGASCSVSILTNVTAIDAKRYDGLILPGGGDINPARYHAENQGSRNISDASDRIQFTAFRRFRRAGKPILGICKGAQVINVAMGGTLYQNIGYGEHYYGKVKPIAVSRKSVFSWYRTHTRVVHWHHQCVKKLGKGLRATMWDWTGRKVNRRIVEAVEGIDEPIYGIQWHPDLMGAAGYPLFRRFVGICRKR